MSATRTCAHLATLAVCALPVSLGLTAPATYAQNYTRKTLATFSGGNGDSPNSLTLGPNSTTRYGTTTNGGASDDGTVFSIPIAGGPSRPSPRSPR